MKNLRKEGFTLIELIAVLVIIAILALIVTPLVMNIIRKARVAADRRSIDAYGRSIELAIASYLLDTGKFPTEVSQLTIEYSGDTVSCITEQINPDSSVYLAGCKVKNRNVEGYSYGTDKSPSYTSYKIGDEVTYNEVVYYVIKDSGVKESSVTLLKEEPLTAEEIAAYKPAEAQTYTSNGYTTMQYHSSSNAYNGSYIKTTVDAWKTAKASDAIEARLITLDELKDNLGYELGATSPSTEGWLPSEDTPVWLYSNDSYWTMTPCNDSTSAVWSILSNGIASAYSVMIEYDGLGLVRPVIVLDKSVLSN